MAVKSSKLQQSNLSKLKVALAYDKVNTWGGAERVILALHEIFPQAQLYTSVYHPQKAKWSKVFSKVSPSFLQNFPLAKSNSNLYATLMPIALESFNFDSYDIVISVTSGETKGIITKPHTLHLSYILTPTRYLWHDPGHLIKAPFLHYLRNWDYIAAQRPDHIATISKTSQARVQKYYKRDSHLIYPPVDTDFFKPTKLGKQSQVKAPQGWNDPFFDKNGNNTLGVDGTINQRYFLIVSRLTPYKKVDLAIKVFNKLKLNLVVVGTGPEFTKLKSLAKPNITLLGHTSKKLLELYQNCLALIMPQEEDFGLVALEAQACGKPVIAFNKGGATETIIANKTGIFFNQQTTSSLSDALHKFHKILSSVKEFNPQDCRQQALKFSLDNFQTQMKQWVITQWKAYQAHLD
jgi:glycosyltransferase involved in cell wall biosynthesis